MSNLEALEEAPAGGTRRARKKERTRREIYRTAMQLFSERDYDSVTIEDICSGAGVAKATFFLHFENKAALLQEFNDEVTQSLADQLAGHDGTAEEQLRFFLDAFLEAYERNAPVMRKMLREFIDQPTALARAATVNDSVIDIVTDIVRRGQNRSELREEMPPELAAVAIVSTWSTIAAFSAEHPETDAGLASRQIIDIMLNGLKKKA
ncbi:TetR/AcrR family transcriptional regulator [Parvibaculum sp.]|uniref:TetR/AcrR family transcriptional regulator n=1 Tax=Parvibaculum sp. TaxID=2024848 RepID=UPI00320C9EE9